MSTDLSLRWDARFRRQLLEVVQFILVLSLNPDDLTSFMNLMNSSTHYAAIAKLLFTASQFCSTYPSDELVESTKQSIRSMYQLLCHQRSVPTVNDTSTISCLHDSLFTVVFEYLDSTSLWRCSAVNTQWRRVSLKMEYMWKHFLQEEFQLVAETVISRQSMKESLSARELYGKSRASIVSLTYSSYGFKRTPVIPSAWVDGIHLRLN